MDKFIRDDGKIGVLISPGYGAGWSTWNSEHSNFALFDHQLITYALLRIEEEIVEEYINATLGNEHFCINGWKNITIKWLDPGTRFMVNEYDGHESLFLLEDLEYTA